jgi:hypothetical protein
MIALRLSKPLIQQLEDALRKAQQTNHLRQYRIVRGLLWLKEGYTVEAIAALLGVSKRTPLN